MSPTGGAVPALPYAFRPRWARRVPLTFALVVLVGGVVMSVAVTDWPVADRILLAATGVLIALFLHRLSAVRIVADESGLTLVNILSRRRLEWAEVVDLHLAEGEPWLSFDVSDGTSVTAMGVQGSEGAYAREQALSIARLVARNSPAPERRGPPDSVEGS